MKLGTLLRLVAILLALDSSGSARADAVVMDAAPKAVVHVRATRPGVVVSESTGVVEGVDVAAQVWKDICVAPCSFQMASGPHALRLGGDEHTPAVETFSLGAGDNYLVAKPGSRSLFGGGLIAAAFGVLGLFSGTVLGIQDGLEGPSMGLLIGGAALGVSGVVMMSAGWSTWERDAAPAGAPARVLSYRGQL